MLRSEVESVPYLCWGGGETGHIISQLVSSYSLETEMKLHKSDVSKLLEGLKTGCRSLNHCLFCLCLTVQIFMHRYGGESLSLQFDLPVPETQKRRFPKF